MVETWSLEYYFLCDVRAVEETGFVTSQNCMSHPSENAHLRNSKASCFPLLPPAQPLPGCEVWATGEDGVSRDCGVLALDTLHQTLNSINCHLQTPDLTVQVPFDIEDDARCMSPGCENLHEDQHPWTLFCRGKQLLSIWAHGSRSSSEPWIAPPRGRFLLLNFLALCPLKKFHTRRETWTFQPRGFALFYNFLFLPGSLTYTKWFFLSLWWRDLGEALLQSATIQTRDVGNVGSEGGRVCVGGSCLEATWIPSEVMFVICDFWPRFYSPNL